MKQPGALPSLWRRGVAGALLPRRQGDGAAAAAQQLSSLPVALALVLAFVLGVSVAVAGDVASRVPLRVLLPMVGGGRAGCDAATLVAAATVVIDAPAPVALLAPQPALQPDEFSMAQPRPLVAPTPPAVAARGPRLAVYGSQDGWSGYISTEFYHLFRLLQNVYGWRVVPHLGHGTASSWDEFGRGVVAGLAAATGGDSAGEPPDVLLIMEDYKAISALTGDRAASPLGRTRVWLYLDDLQTFTDEQRAAKLNSILRADLLLGAYMHVIDRFYPEAAAKPRLWVPHAASLTFQLPLRPGGNVTRRVLLSGATTPLWYPHRADVERRVKAGDTRFHQHAHPGYTGAYAKAIIGAGYAAKLNSYLACLTDGSKVNYTLAKLFEIPGAGCLLLANAEMAPALGWLGFAHGVHYLSYTADTLDAVVDAVLDPANAAAVDAIRGQGQALVWARHTVSHRAEAIHQHAVAGQLPPLPP
jgi:hypothetical protein